MFSRSEYNAYQFSNMIPASTQLQAMTPVSTAQHVQMGHQLWSFVMHDMADMFPQGLPSCPSNGAAYLQMRSVPSIISA